MPWLKAAAFVVYGPAAEMHFRDDPGSPCRSARLFRMRVRAFLVPIGRLSAASAVCRRRPVLHGIVWGPVYIYFFAYMQNFSDIAGTMAAAKGTATIECRGKREKSDDMCAVCWIYEFCCG